MNHHLSHAYYVPEPQGPTRTDKIAENRQILQAAGEHYLSFATGTPGQYTLVESLAENDRKIKLHTISIEEISTGLIVGNGKDGFFPFDWMFRDTANCLFANNAQGQTLRDMHAFIRRAANSEINSICASAGGAKTEVHPITYFAIGAENGLFHMKDGRHACVIQQYERDDHAYLKIVSLDKKHALAKAGVIAGTYIRIDCFKGVEIPKDFEKTRGKKRIEHMLAFRDFVAERMKGRARALKIPTKTQEVAVEVARTPLLTLVASNGKSVEQAPTVTQTETGDAITDFVIGEVGKYSVADGKHEMVVSQDRQKKKLRITVEKIDPDHLLAHAGITVGTTVSAAVITSDAVLWTLRGNAHLKGVPEKIALVQFIREKLLEQKERKAA